MLATLARVLGWAALFAACNSTAAFAGVVYSINDQSAVHAFGAYYVGTIRVTDGAAADGVLEFAEIESYLITVYHQALPAFTLTTIDGGFVSNSVGIDESRIYLTAPSAASDNSFVLGAAFPGPYVDWVNRVSVAPYLWTSFKNDSLNAAVIAYYPGGTVNAGGTISIARRVSPVPEPTSMALAGFAGIGMAVGAWRRRRQQAA